MEVESKTKFVSELAIVSALLLSHQNQSTSYLLPSGSRDALLADDQELPRQLCSAPHLFDLPVIQQSREYQVRVQDAERRDDGGGETASSFLLVSGLPRLVCRWLVSSLTRFGHQCILLAPTSRPRTYASIPRIGELKASKEGSAGVDKSNPRNYATRYAIIFH